jgi:hypothetical protein
MKFVVWQCKSEQEEQKLGLVGAENGVVVVLYGARPGVWGGVFTTGRLLCYRCAFLVARPHTAFQQADKTGADVQRGNCCVSR